MTPDIYAKVASALRARHYSKIASALRARHYDAQSVRGRRGILCVRVAVPGTDCYAWWGITSAWWSSTTTGQTWGGVLYQGPGQIVQVGEFVTTISSTTTDIEKIAEEIAIGIDEAEIEAVSLQELRFEQ